MSKVLITGAAGYIGSSLAKFLIGRNIDVTLIDNYQKPSNITSVENVEIQKKDIRDIKNLENYDTIFHLAGIVGLRECEQDTKLAHDINVRGTFNLLKTCKGRFVFASSSAVYGEASEPEITEAMATKARSTYGKNKLEAENLIKLHNDYCILRFSNIYGKGITYKRTVADMFIENSLKEKDLLIHGDGKQRRDFIHIKDVIKAYWYAMRSPVNNTFNIGGNEALSINDIAELVSKNHRQLFGLTPKISHMPINSGVLWKDFTYSSLKAKQFLGYEPSYSVSDEIRGRLSAHSKKQ